MLLYCIALSSSRENQRSAQEVAWDVTKLNVCRSRRCRTFGARIGQIVKTYDYIIRVVITLPLMVYEGMWTTLSPLVAMHHLDGSCVCVGNFLKLRSSPTVWTPIVNLCTVQDTYTTHREVCDRMNYVHAPNSIARVPLLMLHLTMAYCGAM